MNDNDEPDPREFNPAGCRIIIALALLFWVGVIAVVRACWWPS